MRKAFTILEIVIVLVVVGILAAVAIPRLTTDKLLEDSNKLIDWIRYTQHLAMIDDKFDPNNRYWQKNGWCINLQNENIGIFSKNYDNSNTLIKTTYALNPLDKKEIKQMQLDSDLNDTKVICFDSIGRPYENTIEYSNILKKPYEIRIKYEGQSRTIKIENETGYTHFAG